MKKGLPILSLILSLTILSCTIPDISISSNNSKPSFNTGTLKLTLDTSDILRTIIPDVDMNVSCYNISGTGPDGASFQKNNIIESSVSINSLAAGDWKIYAVVKNSSDQIIADGSSNVVIVENSTVNSIINLYPLAGDGTFTLAVAWSSTDFPSGTPVITAVMTSVNGTNINLNFTTNTNSAICSQVLPSGYYDLNITAESGSNTGYFYDAVRIVYDQITSAEILIKPEISANGGITISLIADLQNPIEIFFSGNLSELLLGNNMTVSATTVPDQVDTYQWMLNYQNISGANSSSIIIGSNLSAGSYILTLRVRKDTIISSKSIGFDVVETASAITLIMVYLDCDNNLESYGLDDLNEMESVNLQGTGIKIITLVDRISGYSNIEGDWTNTRLYEINYDTGGYNSTIVSTRLSGMGLTDTGNEELNMGNPATLSNFIDFCKTNYIADNYVLVLWNHGGGWRSKEIAVAPITKAVCWDDTNGGDCLYISEVKSAVSSKGLSLIGFDACLMGMVEVAYELRNCAQTMVASEETEPGDGWDYIALLNQYKASDLSMNALADAVVDSYSSFYTYSETTMSAIDLTQMHSFSNTLTSFSNYLSGITTSEVTLARNSTIYFAEINYIDLYDFADNFSSAEASAIKTAIQDCVLYNWSHSNLHAHGLSIYFPVGSIDPNYSTAIELSTDSTWISFLNNYINTISSPDSFEPDDIYAQASTLLNGIIQNHNFHTGSDNDWASLTVNADDTYTIETIPVTSSIDTYMYLYDTNGTTLISGNDDAGINYCSLITYTFTSAGTYYIRVNPFSSNEINKYYNLSATKIKSSSNLL